MGRNIQLGLRIDKKLLDKIEFLATNEGINRNLWIKRALATFVRGQEEGIREEATEDYILLRIDKKTFLKFTNYDNVPEDIENARKQKLKQILEVKYDGKNIHK